MPRTKEAASEARAAGAEPRYVFTFGEGKAQGAGSMKELLGGKGAGLAEMSALGLPVPPGFTVTTEACRRYFASERQLPPGLWDQVLHGLRHIETVAGERFGGPGRPLLLSVRSGARASMPGMMDTVLNLGLNDVTVGDLARATRNERFAMDAYRRFVEIFGSVVLGVRRELFAEALEEAKRAAGARFDTELGAKPLADLTARYKKIIRAAAGCRLPEGPFEQLRLAVRAVFDSWYGARAATYRRLNAIPADWGTAANIQAMVFGNLGPNSGSGVAFTRDPNTGERKLFGEFLFEAQGEDVVSGVRTPLAVAALERELPGAYRDLTRFCATLEAHYRDMLDVEFTVEQGRLRMLQVRVGKRAAPAAVRMAVEMADEKLIDRTTALLRVGAEQLEQLLHPMVDPKEKTKVLAKGLPASRGAAVGKVVFTAEEAEAAAGKGERVILVRVETSSEDIAGMHAAQGILTTRGGMTSHAAVVARGMGKCCVVGCGAITVREEERYLEADGVPVHAGDVITLNGGTGEVLFGEARLVRPETGPEFQTLLAWADAAARLEVRANADTPEDARVARRLGARGIGLCRTEHMFFAPDRILAVREMILAEDAEGRGRALQKILPMQRDDFLQLFREMAGLPVTVRLLDPPLHEFLPRTDAAIGDLARSMGLAEDRVRSRVRALREFNPMLGLRGCRVGILFPEIYEAQARAIFEAACAAAEEGIAPEPQIMIPIVVEAEELRRLRVLCVKTAAEVMDRAGVTVGFKVGTMIEIPRAALLADRVAREAEFFSFGTNDLTQTAFGLSRDDSGLFLPTYLQQGVLQEDPFVTLDQDGVGLLMRWAVERGRAARAELEIGICGEHGGDPASVDFCHRLGLDYVSCSPYRVPVARLAAAQAALRGESRLVDAAV